MPNVPRKFYKYIKQEHLRSFFKNGDIRIGTLHDFQSNEKHNYQILDSEEGVKSANKVINWSGGPDDQPAFDRKFFRVGADNVAIKNILLKEEIRSPNCFIFSVSASFSVEVMKKMNPEYDACIAILKPDEFFREIAKKLQDKISKWAFGPCYYITRNLPHDKQHNIHPAWIKDPEYSYQEEYRMIMIPNIDEIQPLFMAISGFPKSQSDLDSVRYRDWLLIAMYRYTGESDQAYLGGQVLRLNRSSYREFHANFAHLA